MTAVSCKWQISVTGLETAGPAELAIANILGRQIVINSFWELIAKSFPLISNIFLTGASVDFIEAFFSVADVKGLKSANSFFSKKTQFRNCDSLAIVPQLQVYCFFFAF